jgi:GNAT superfamily N-acetyltransferase
MPPVPSVRRFASHEWTTYRDLRLRSLADSPDAFGGTLAQAQGLTDEEWAERLARGVASPLDEPLLARLGGVPVGLAWGRIEPTERGTARLYQVWVAASARRHGLGRMLVQAAIAWATQVGARVLTLGVTCDTPAMRLYGSEGFVPHGEPGPIRPGATRLGQEMRRELG